MSYVIEADGRKRRALIRICEQCGKEFLRATNRRKPKQYFCSRTCQLNYQKRNNITICCSYCGEKIIKVPTKISASKHNVYFCNKQCKDKGQSIEGGVTEIMPPHYNKGVASYRDKAFKNKKAICKCCGYDKYKNVLIVHHKDKNRENNNINNLVILCPTCHIEIHRGHKNI